jgi:hypothetical protein
MYFGTVVKLIFWICLYELYARYRARRLPPGISGLRCLFEMPKEKGWLKMFKFNQEYGLPSYDHEVRRPDHSPDR